VDGDPVDLTGAEITPLGDREPPRGATHGDPAASGRPSR
jgi:hypothetical protein